MINGNYTRDIDLNNDLHNTYNAMVGCTWNKLKNFRIFGVIPVVKRLYILLVRFIHPAHQHKFLVGHPAKPFPQLCGQLDEIWIS